MPTEAACTMQVKHPFARFSVRNDVERLKKQVVDQKFILDDLFLQGQASLLYAAPNTGKTLLILHMIMVGIERGRFDPRDLYYFNMDDNGTGAVEKATLAQEAGFEMVLPGEHGFSVDQFSTLLEEVMEKGRARNTIIVLDTLTKFTNTMSKEASREFSLLIRPFVLRGGTVIALGHTNKHVNTAGEPVYAGTSDLVNDFDCAYVLSDTKAAQGDQKVVEFKNIKRRGNSALKAVYTYGVNEQDYQQLLMSVSRLEEADFNALEAQASLDRDDNVITAIRQAIGRGKNTKMVLITAVREAAGISKRAAEKILVKYTGTCPQEHFWQVEVKAHGRMEYSLLTRPPQPQQTAAAVTRPIPVEKPAALLTEAHVRDRMERGDY